MCWAANVRPADAAAGNWENRNEERGEGDGSPARRHCVRLRGHAVPQRTMMPHERAQRRCAATFRCLILLAVVSVSVLLGACSGTPPPPPPGLCAWNGEAAPPASNYDEPVTAPAVANGVVYIGFSVSADGAHFHTSIAAFHASDGSLIWQRQDPIGAASLVAGGDVLILSNATALVALRTTDGSVLW